MTSCPHAASPPPRTRTHARQTRTAKSAAARRLPPPRWHQNDTLTGEALEVQNRITASRMLRLVSPFQSLSDSVWRHYLIITVQSFRIRLALGSENYPRIVVWLSDWQCIVWQTSLPDNGTVWAHYQNPGFDYHCTIVSDQPRSSECLTFACIR